jgi:hypothetical protein
LETNEAVEELKKFVLEHSLPKTEMALFGILCPYCGKSDRIRQLENPQALAGRRIIGCLQILPESPFAQRYGKCRPLI